MGLFDKIFGTHSEHELKRIYPIVDKIEGMREDMAALSDEEDQRIQETSERGRDTG